MISARIDVTKIDKERLYKGEKGTYLDLILIPTPDGKYGDYMIVQQITKEERAAGKKGNTLGNGKILSAKSNPQPETKSSGESDDLPF